MDDKTTTDATPAEDTGVDETLPVEQEEQAAATEPAEPISTDAEGDAEEESLPKEDNKLEAWAKSKGIPLDSDGARKAAKIAMDNQAEFQRTRQKTSELEKTLRADLTQAAEAGDSNTVAQLAEEVQNLKLAQSVNEFFSSGSESEVAEKKVLEPVMTKIVNDDPNIGRLVKAGYISYEQLAAMARGSDIGRDAKLKQDGGREALQKVADKSTAKAVAGSATTSDISVPEKDPFLEGFNATARN